MRSSDISFLTYCLNRLFEWMMAVSLLLMSVPMLFWPNTIEVGQFKYVLQVMTQRELFLLCFLSGALRVSFLAANGYLYRYGPRLRVAGAIIGSFFWLEMGLALVFMGIEINNLSPSVSLYGMLIVGEFVSIYRAMLDGKR